MDGDISRWCKTLFLHQEQVNLVLVKARCFLELLKGLESYSVVFVKLLGF